MLPPRTIILATSLPGNRHVGETYIQRVVTCLEPQVACIGVLNRSERCPKVVEPNNCYVCSRRYENAPSACTRRVFSFLVSIFQRLLLRVHAHRQIERIIESGFCSGADCLLAFLDSPTTILMARPLAERMNVPLRTLVWDAPDWIVKRDRMLAPVARMVLREFDRCMHSSAACGVMCEQAAAEYSERYNVKTTIVRHGVPDEWFGGLRTPPTSEEDEYRIGFCGSITAPDTFNAFLEALDQMEWVLAGRPVRLVVVGGHFKFAAGNARCIEWLGNLPGEEDVIQRLASCHMLYLPQPFDPSRRRVATISFPAKMSTYLATGRPVFSHGPPESSVARFLAETPAGWHCASLRKDEIARMLIECGQTLFQPSLIGHHVRAAFFNNASLSLMKTRLAELLQDDRGVDQ